MGDEVKFLLIMRLDAIDLLVDRRMLELLLCMMRSTFVLERRERRVQMGRVWKMGSMRLFDLFWVTKGLVGIVLTIDERKGYQPASKLTKY